MNDLEAQLNAGEIITAVCQTVNNFAKNLASTPLVSRIPALDSTLLLTAVYDLQALPRLNSECNYRGIQQKVNHALDTMLAYFLESRITGSDNLNSFEAYLSDPITRQITRLAENAGQLSVSLEEQRGYDMNLVFEVHMPLLKEAEEYIGEFQYANVRDLFKRAGRGEKNVGIEISFAVQKALENPHMTHATVLRSLSELIQDYDALQRNGNSLAASVERSLAVLAQDYDVPCIDGYETILPNPDQKIELLRDLAFVKKECGEYDPSDPITNAVNAFRSFKEEVESNGNSVQCRLRSGRQMIANATIYCLENGYHNLGQERAQISREKILALLT